MVEGFKHTEVGLIPNDWEVKTFGEFGTINGRVGWKGYTKNDLRPIGPYAIGAKHIDKSNQLDLSDPTHLTIEKYLESPEIMVFKYDILIVQRGSIGKVVFIDKEIGEATINPSMVILRLKQNSPTFVFYYLVSSTGQKQIVFDTSSTGVPMITQKQVANFKIPLPPTEAEQTAIATALKDADALINQFELLLTKKRNIKTGALQELLRPKEGWEEKYLTELIDYIHGKAHEKYIEENGKYIVVNSKFISSDGKVIKYSNDNFCPAKKEDILTVLSDLPNGKALAKCYYVKEDKKYAVNQRICVWRSKGAFPKFLFYILNRNKYFVGLDDGISQTHILNHHIEKCKISIPTDMEEQQRIAEILTDMDNEINGLEKELQKYEMVKQGMMQVLLTGKIRLV
jgi:type I restriction enzyme S subunit